MNPIKLIKELYCSNIVAERYLIAHSEKVAEKALEIADKNKHLIVNLDFVYEASMMHDIGIIRTNAVAIGCIGTEPYIKHGIIGFELLSERGLPRHARVCLTHVGVGLTAVEISKNNLTLPRIDMLPEGIEEKLVCFADKFYSKSPKYLLNPKPLDKIVRDVSFYGPENYKRLLELIRLFNYSE